MNNWDKIFTSGEFCVDLTPREFVTDNIIFDPSKGPIIDIGCGCGRHLVYLTSRGYEVYGTDYSEVAVAKAKENLAKYDLKAELEVRNMWEIPFDGKKFAAAISINVMNHGMPDQILETVKAIHARLVPEGLFLLTLLEKGDFRMCGEQLGPDTFIGNKGAEAGVLHTFFDEESVRDLVKDHFVVEDIQHTSWVSEIKGKDETGKSMRIKTRKL